MKSKILLVISLILALGTICLCFRNIQLRKQLESYTPQVISKIDTVYLDKPFKVEAPYKEVSTPTKVTVYKGGLEKDTSTSQSKDSVVQFKLDKSTLDLTLYNLSDSTVHTNKYHIDLDKYKYTYNNGVLTQKKKYIKKKKTLSSLSYTYSSFDKTIIPPHIQSPLPECI